MNQRTLSIAAALSLSAALFGATSASASTATRLDSEGTVKAQIVSLRVAERTASSVPTATSTTMSPRVAERLDSSEPDDLTRHPRMGDHGL